MCTVLLPPGYNPIAVNKYINQSISYSNNAQVLQVSARLPTTRNEFYDFPQDPYANFCTVTSGRTSFHFFFFCFVVYPPHTIVFPTHFTPYIQMAALEITPAGMGVSGAVRESIYLIFPY